jgi:hypothetical protein
MRTAIHVGFALALLAGAATSRAQSAFKFISNFSRPGQALPVECSRAGAALDASLAAYPHPGKWTYIIACDDIAWQRVLLHLEMSERKGKIYGVTDTTSQLTYLRGATLVVPDDPRASAEYVVAHELCHIYLWGLNRNWSRDESKVEKLALSWVADRLRKTDVSVISAPATAVLASK